MSTETNFRTAALEAVLILWTRMMNSTGNPHPTIIHDYLTDQCQMEISRSTVIRRLADLKNDGFITSDGKLLTQKGLERLKEMKKVWDSPNFMSLSYYNLCGYFGVFLWPFFDIDFDHIVEKSLETNDTTTVDLDMNAEAVLMVVANIVCHNKNKTATIQTIVDVMDDQISASTVSRRLNKLINLGYITTDRKFLTKKGADKVFELYNLWNSDNWDNISYYDMDITTYLDPDYLVSDADATEETVRAKLINQEDDHKGCLNEEVSCDESQHLQYCQATIPKNKKSDFTYSYVSSGSFINIFQHDKFGNIMPKVFMENTGQFNTANDIIADPTVIKSDDGLIADSRMDDLFAEKTLPSLIAIKTKNRVIIDPDSYTVSIDGLNVTNSLIDIILSVYTHQSTEKYSLETLINFIDKLVDNPSRKVFDYLYDFLKYNDIEINEDGDIIAWKKVRHNYMDIHSNSMSNAPGTTVKMARIAVNDDPKVTCSHGLHVCAKGYLSHFGCSSDDRVVKVKVNPKDFVSIPNDYDGKKARVCEYVVLEDVTDTI